MNDDYVVRWNIRRFEWLLANERDPERRARLNALLASERQKVTPPAGEREPPQRPE